MKTILHTFILMLCFYSQAQKMTTPDFWQADKIKHSAVSFGISTATYTYLSVHKKHKKLPELHKRVIALSTTLIVGALKEVVDSQSSTGVASWADMSANTVGALAFQASITIPLRIRSKHRKKRKIDRSITARTPATSAKTM